MKTTYKNYIRWDLDISTISKPEEQFSSKKMQKYRQTMRKLAESEYRFRVEKLTPQLLEDFVNIYDVYMDSKERGIVYPVRDTIQDGWHNKNREYEIISLYKGDELIGGLIFRLMLTGIITISYRVFPFNIDVKIPLAPAYIAEYLLVKRALELNATKILHGRDQNAFGLNSDIGLAVYKLRAGAIPHISAMQDNPTNVLPTKLQADTLLFLGDKPRQTCSEMVLYTDMSADEVNAKYPIFASQTNIPFRIEKR